MYDVDVAIIGAGSAGLTLARTLLPFGVSVLCIDKTPQNILANPSADGREIALTHTSLALLNNIGASIDHQDMHPLLGAKVYNNTRAKALSFYPPKGEKYLGNLVAHNVIRQVLFSDKIPFFHAHATGIDDSMHGKIVRTNQADIHARMVAVADSRFSLGRTFLGIDAIHRDFGQDALVFTIKHTRTHNHITSERFLDGYTVALLPFKDGYSGNCVLTAPPALLDNLDDNALTTLIQNALNIGSITLGDINITGARHRYPLIGVLAKEFIAHRSALIGDAAAGLHPVTAHGLNLGIAGAHHLGRLIGHSMRVGHDIDRVLLQKYALAHKARVLPLYYGTQMVVDIFSQPQQWMRNGLIGFADKALPIKALITKQLTG